MGVCVPEPAHTHFEYMHIKRAKHRKTCTHKFAPHKPVTHTHTCLLACAPSHPLHPYMHIDTHAQTRTYTHIHTPTCAHQSPPKRKMPPRFPTHSMSVHL